MKLPRNWFLYVTQAAAYAANFYLLVSAARYLPIVLEWLVRDTNLYMSVSTTIGLFSIWGSTNKLKKNL